MEWLNYLLIAYMILSSGKSILFPLKIYYLVEDLDTFFHKGCNNFNWNDQVTFV